MECVNYGFTVEYVDNLYVPEFISTYRSLQRVKARRDLKLMAIVGHAFGGSKKENSKFIKSLSVWLPSWEKYSGNSNEEFVSAMMKGQK